MEFGKIMYAVEKYGNAVDTLATGRGAIKDRLVSAVYAISVLRPENFPPDLLGDHEWIIRETTRWPAELPGEGAIQATVRHMAEERAAEVAERILRVYRGVYRGVESLRRTTAVEGISTRTSPASKAPIEKEPAVRPVKDPRRVKKRSARTRPRKTARK